MRRIGCALETKSFSENGDVYVMEGYASIFNNVDLDGDVMMPGAFTKSLQKRTPRFLWGHAQHEVCIGLIDEIREEKKGLWHRAILPKDDDFVRGRIAPQMRIGALKDESIGFRTKRRERKGNVNQLHEVDLFEISMVNIGANPEAGSTDFKSIGVTEFNDELPLAARARKWCESDALERVKRHLEIGEYATDDYRQAFLFSDPHYSNDPSSCKFLICDVIDGRLTAVPAAIYKSCAALMGTSDSELNSEVKQALQDTLDRYYARLDPASSTKSLSKGEWEHLEPSEREARLRAGATFTGGLAKMLSSNGPRDVDRPHRDGGSDEELKMLLKAALQERSNAK
ncbi:MAG: HK97 family phage prohead protease [Filomicrobium sp.]